MKTTDCENIMCAALARIDGETSPLSEEAIRNHITSCQRCRDELADLASALQPLNEQKRGMFEDDLWPEIEAGLVSPEQTSANLQQVVIFSLFGIFLLVIKALELSPAILPGPFIKCAALVVTVGFFCVLKSNPFRIQEDLNTLAGSGSSWTVREMEDNHVISSY
ncbi:zf-HC2 domain-containing protein [Planctomycetota bacterium]